MQTIPCPACGVQNRIGSKTCRMCNAALAAGNATAAKVLRRADFAAAARANMRRTNRLIVVLILIGGLLGYLIGWNLELATTDVLQREQSIWFLSRWGLCGALGLLALSLIWTIVALKAGDKIVLRIVGGSEASREQEPVLHNVVEEMAIAAGLPKPKIYVIETPAMNAFATGLSTSRAAIGVTRGLLDNLSRDELQGVIAHEMGHIVNLDMRYATAVGVMVGLIALVADQAWRVMYYGGGRSSSRRKGPGGHPIAVVLLVLFALLAPLFAKLVQMAVSRQREFLADATSVRLTRNPHGLIGALEKLSQDPVPFDGVNRATQHLFIVNPLKSFGERASALMATHPPLAARINRLRNLGAD